MASGFCTGPALFYAGVGRGNAALFVGTSEGEPEIQTSPQWEGVPNDLAGTKLPLDYQFQGEEDFVSAVFTRYNEAAVAAVQTRTRTLAARGLVPAGGLGAFAGLEGLTFQLWLVFPYAAKPAMAANGMPAGYHYFAAFSVGERMPVGTKARRVHLQFHCIRTFSIGAVGGYGLYDHNVAGLPAIN